MVLTLSVALLALVASSTVSGRVSKAPGGHAAPHLVVRDDKFQFSINKDAKFIPPDTKDFNGDKSLNLDPLPQDTAPLCKRAGGALSIRCSVPPPDRSCYTAGDPKMQRPLQQLTQQQRGQIWRYAKYQGTGLRKQMSEAAINKVSRLSDADKMRQDMTAKTFYSTPEAGVSPVNMEKAVRGITAAFKDARCSIDEQETEDLDYIELFPKKSGYSDLRTQGIPAIIGMGAHGPTGLIVSTKSEAMVDDNDDSEKATTSALTWSAWRQISSMLEYKSLKYHMRACIANDETLNVMKMAHQQFPGNVDMKGYPPLTMLEAAHGIWRPGDPGYDALLSTDNVRVAVNMILDHADEMENPFITEIHTFGAYWKQPDPTEEYDEDNHYVRPDMIIIKYGPASADAINALNLDDEANGTVQTS